MYQLLLSHQMDTVDRHPRVIVVTIRIMVRVMAMATAIRTITATQMVSFMPLVLEGIFTPHSWLPTESHLDLLVLVRQHIEDCLPTEAQKSPELAP